MERGGFADLNLPLDAEADEHTHRERLALALRLGSRSFKTRCDTLLIALARRL